MRSVWRVVFIMILIFVMGFSIISSANNGSSIGNIMKKSAVVKTMEKKMNKMVKEVLR